MSLARVLALCFLATPLAAGPIRPTAQMGPVARRLLAGIRTEREARDQARLLAQLRRRVAVIRVRTPGEDFDVATRVARCFETQLRDRGFLVRPFRKVWPRLQAAEAELTASDHALRQLARRLKVGLLLLVEVRELRVADGRNAAFAVPSWWGSRELDQEFAETHLRLEVFDAAEGRTVADRQDRQHRLVPHTAPLPGVLPEGASMRDQVLDEVLAAATAHVLHDLAPPGPVPPGGAPPPRDEVATEAATAASRGTGS